ncbi:ribonuclease III [Aestuariivirga litoralis]|uniref:ribonuclease III n=1 Tax=Aestuariivirga litoralis TaxID=2650924 RepID=UPI0018C48C81|nr:ribonuclease III [Aestuariivirga litoralis]
MRSLSKVEERLEYQFKSQILISAALTHGSQQKAERDYQRLEFLGDRVLNLVIADELYARFPDEKEGPLAARLSLLVRAEACTRVGEALGLQAFIAVGAMERKQGVQRMASVLSDVVEALIGALYLDGGMDVARGFILKQWQAMLTQAPETLKDAKTFVQEWALGRGLPLPAYVVQNREGPDHAPRFTISLQVGDLASVHGQGLSKQLAEMDAASAFIAREGLR